MKQMKFLPFLIAAASYVPRAHAAEAAQQAEPGSLATILICLALVIFCNVGSRSPAIKPEQ